MFKSLAMAWMFTGDAAITLLLLEVRDPQGPLLPCQAALSTLLFPGHVAP